MVKWIKWMGVGSVVWILWGGGNILAQEVEILADDGYPPYSFKNEQGKAAGLYKEVVEKVIAAMPTYKVTIKPLPWKRGLSMIEDGSGFALYPPYHNTEKRPWMWPYSLPMLEERTIVYCQEGVFTQGPRPNWPEDYYGLRIANNQGFAFGGEKFFQAAKDGKLVLDEGRTTEMNVLKLGMKRVDCYINDKLSILAEINRLAKTEDGKELKTARLTEGATISFEWGFLGYSAKAKAPYKEDFMRRFDAELYRLRKSGELNRIITAFLEAQ